MIKTPIGIDRSSPSKPSLFNFAGRDILITRWSKLKKDSLYFSLRDDFCYRRVHFWLIGWLIVVFFLLSFLSLLFSIFIFFHFLLVFNFIFIERRNLDSGHLVVKGLRTMRWIQLNQFWVLFFFFCHRRFLVWINCIKRTGILILYCFIYSVTWQCRFIYRLAIQSIIY